MVPVAQLAEHLTVDQVVVGSNPIRHPAYIGDFERNLFFCPDAGSGFLQSFHISIFMPCAIVCNAGGWHRKKVLLDITTPIYGDLIDLIPPYVGYGPSGWLPSQNQVNLFPGAIKSDK